MNEFKGCKHVLASRVRPDREAGSGVGALALPATYIIDTLCTLKPRPGSSADMTHLVGPKILAALVHVTNNGTAVQVLVGAPRFLR